MLSHALDPALFYSCTSQHSWWYGRSIGACSRRPWLAPSTPSPEVHGRQKSSAALLSFIPSAFLARISAPMSQATADVISDVRGHYDVPDGDQAAGVEDKGWYRTGLKCKAADTSRTQYVVYWFSTKHNLSEAAVDRSNLLSSSVPTSRSAMRSS